jgi:phosphoribosylaminoimidazole-succinocarboxamide synthase
MLDKEFFRQWLIKERNYQGDGPDPLIPDEVRAQLAGRYVELVETLTGQSPNLVPGSTRDRIEQNLRKRGYL